MLSSSFNKKCFHACVYREMSWSQRHITETLWAIRGALSRKPLTCQICLFFPSFRQVDRNSLSLDIQCLFSLSLAAYLTERLKQFLEKLDRV